MQAAVDVLREYSDTQRNTRSDAGTRLARHTAGAFLGPSGIKAPRRRAARAGAKRQGTWDEVEIGNLVDSLMCQLESVFEGGMLQENAQMVVRPIFTWPDGKLRVWVMINWRN